MRRRLLLFLLLCLALPAVGWMSVLGQNIVAKGKVVDERNLPLPGATVRSKSASNVGTYTNADGVFSLSVKQGSTLVIHFLGYKAVEMAASGNMQVKLLPDNTQLEDVVVVGYMPRKVTNISASVVKVDAKTIENKPVANPLDALQGKIPGLQIYSSSGEPSATLSMALHGQGSLGAGTTPLIIMDGNPVSPLVIRSMNSNDIESVQFLKDAAATSIYGARAANGVMYITTKRGSSDKRANIKVNMQYAVSTLANTDYFDQLMNAKELLRYYEETGLHTASELDWLKENTFKGTDFSWYKYVYQPAPMLSADLSISGGSGDFNYYISGGAMKQDGLRMGSNYKKAFGRLNLNGKLNKYMSLGLNSSVSFDDSKVSPFGGSNASGGGLAAMNPPFISPYDPETGRELDYIPILDMTSPKHYVETHPSNSKAVILQASGHLTARINKFTFRTQAGVEANYGTGASRSLPSFRRSYGVGGASRSYSSVVNFTTTNTASYQADWGEHSLTALLGHEYIAYKDDGFSASGSGLLDDRLHLLSSTTKDFYIGEGSLSHAYLSFFTQLAYDYRSKYFVDLVLRNDASSRFGKNTRNGLFWSLGLMWKLKNEAFLRHVSWINSLDLKASYGTQGNSAIAPYLINSYVNKAGQKMDKLSFGFASFGNPDLSWEKQSKLTIGAKARLFDRLDVSLEYYRRDTHDMLFEVPLSYSVGLPMGAFGYVSRFENVGRFMNQGIDLSIAADVLRGKDYRIGVHANLNYNSDKVLELFDGRQSWIDPSTKLAYIVDKPVTFVLPIHKGINTDTGVPEWYVPGQDRTITTRDNNSVANEYSASLEQNTGVKAYTPITGGWGLNAQWKGFYMNADFFFAIDKHIMSMDKMSYENDYHIRNSQANFNGSRRLFDYWKQPGDKTEFPSIEWVRANNRSSTYADTKLLENASFMRLKNLTIGYQVPKEKLGRQNILTSLRVYLTARNLVTFTSFRGIDPEVNHTAALGVNPNTKQVSIGVQLGL